MVGSGRIQEVFAIYQPENLLILSKRGLVPQLYSILGGHLHREQKN